LLVACGDPTMREGAPTDNPATADTAAPAPESTPAAGQPIMLTPDVVATLGIQPDGFICGPHCCIACGPGGCAGGCL
jgi:hypothetical protein